MFGQKILKGKLNHTRIFAQEI